MNIGPTATEDDIQSVLENLSTLSPDLLATCSSKEHLRKDALMSRFMKHCCRETLYGFQIKKCGDQQCAVPGCGKTRMDPDDFKKLVHWLPDPTKKPTSGEPTRHVKDEWYGFDDLYGKMDTTENDRPSMQATTEKKVASAADKDKRAWFTQANIVGQIRCCVCGKHRSIWCRPRATLTTSQKQVLQDVAAAEVNPYSCGALIVDDEHPLGLLITTRMQVSCATPQSQDVYQHCAAMDEVPATTRNPKHATSHNKHILPNYN